MAAPKLEDAEKFLTAFCKIAGGDKNWDFSKIKRRWVNTHPRREQYDI